MNSKKIAAGLYGQIFGYSLTEREMDFWQIGTVKSEGLNFKFKANNKLREILKVRTVEKIAMANSVIKNLKKIPTIAAIFLTGSVAAGNPKKDADVDLLIVTFPGTLWITRLLIVIFLKRKQLYKNIICPNIFLDTNNLEIKEKNLYTAHEILQAKTIFDRGNFYQQFLQKNSWTKKYLPKVFARCRAELVSASPKTEVFWTRHRNKFGVTLLFPIELLCFIAQYLYQKPKQSNERLSWGFAFFHPNQLSNKVLKKYRAELSKLGIMETNET